MPLNKRKILERLLRFMARQVLKKYRPLVVGITGSVGKSSTKEAAALVLSKAYRVRKADGNYNNEIGIPLTIIGSPSGGSSFVRWGIVFLKWFGLMLFPLRYPEVLILELGIDRPGDMEYLLEFVPINIGVVTQISSSHVAYFGSVSHIAKEKGKLIAALPENGFAVLNADDKRTLRMTERTRAKTYTFGFDEGAMIRADNLLFHKDTRRVDGFSFKLNFEGKSIPVRLPRIVARHHIPAALAAVSIGVALKMNLVEIAESLEAFEPLPGRLRLLPGREEAVLLDDTYNASPSSTEAALHVVQEMMAPRKIVVLGDMLELGEDSAQEHAALKEAVKSSGASIVVTVGKHMRALHEALSLDGYTRNQLIWMPDPMAAIDAVLAILRPNDLVLIKGSQGMRMEKITEQLLPDTRMAALLLCRQSDEWLKRQFIPPEEWTE